MTAKLNPIEGYEDYVEHPHVYNKAIQALGNALIGRIQHIMDASAYEIDSLPAQMDEFNEHHVDQIMKVNKQMCYYQIGLYNSFQRLSAMKVRQVPRNFGSMMDDLASLSLNGSQVSQPSLTPPSERSPENARARSSDDSNPVVVKKMKTASVNSSVVNLVCESDHLPPVTSLTPQEWTDLMFKMKPKIPTKSVWVTVSYVSSFDSFFITCDNDLQNELHSLLQTSVIKMRKAGLTKLDQDQIQEGTICAARYSEDGTYYRAQIESIDEAGEAAVYFIDYGNREKVNQDCLMPLEDSLRQDYRVQSIKCVLNDYLEIINRENALVNFKRIVNDRNNYIKAVILGDPRCPEPYFWINCLTRQVCIDPRIVNIYVCPKSDPSNAVGIMSLLQ